MPKRIAMVNAEVRPVVLLCSPSLIAPDLGAHTNPPRDVFFECSIYVLLLFLLKNIKLSDLHSTNKLKEHSEHTLLNDVTNYLKT